MGDVREYTNKLIGYCEEGILSKDKVFDEFMCYLSEDEIKEFCEEGFGGELRDLFNEEEEND